MDIDPLITTLIDLSQATSSHNFKLILGGGLGLYLKQLHRQNDTSPRTLIPGELWPFPRATEDIDLLLPTEIVVDIDHMQGLRTTLDALGFQPVPEAKFLHFSKPWSNGGRVKIDMLTGPISDPDNRAKVQFAPPRVRPRGKLQLHAYLTPEAIDFDKSLLPINIDGMRSDGNPSRVTVHIPQPFTFLLMKLHAFSDRAHVTARDLGRHHALDVYRIVAMLTIEEFDTVRAGVKQHEATAAVQQARKIVAEEFGSPTSLGILRLREHSLFLPSMDFLKLIAALRDMFT